MVESESENLFFHREPTDQARIESCGKYWYAVQLTCIKYYKIDQPKLDSYESKYDSQILPIKFGNIHF